MERLPSSPGEASRSPSAPSGTRSLGDKHIEVIGRGRLILAGTGMPYYQRVEIPEEVYEAREETFDQDYSKPDFGGAAEEAVVTGGSYGGDA